MSSIELNVQGMTCSACARHVTAALQPLAGVVAVEVDLQAGRVRVQGEADSAALLVALDDAGYPAQLATPAPAADVAKPGCCGCGCR